METFYLEYRILRNRPGLLGDITSLMGLLNINILTINGVSGDWRGFLITGNQKKILTLKGALQAIENIRITYLRNPEPIDYVTVKHGQRVQAVQETPSTYQFLREELGLLIDFLGELLKSDGNIIIGVKGMPRVGKTEAAISGCVYAQKRWILLSSTIIRQNIRAQLLPEELTKECVYLIDGVTSTSRGGPEHWALLKQVMSLNVPKIIEHPDVFARDGIIQDISYDYILELRHSPDEEIATENISSSFSAFDIS